MTASPRPLPGKPTPETATTAEPETAIPEARPQPHHSLSAILAHLAQDPARERIAIADLLETMRARAFGAMLIVFAFPNILPSPPGLAGILGMPLIFLSLQMMLGRPAWLPGFIARRSMPRSTFAAMVERVNPWLDRAEGLLRHRLPALSGDTAQKVLGLVCFILAVALALPVPFANLAPAAAICIIGLGILERDGICIGLGVLASVGALAWVAGLGYALVKSAIFVITSAF